MHEPKAWTITDLSKHREQFTITASPTVGGMSDNSEAGHQGSNNGKRQQPAGFFPTEADKAVRFYQTHMNRDEIGEEDYWTVYETKPDSKAFASYHFMLLGDRGEQKFHFHPPAKGSDGSSIKESSIRHVILFPLWHRDKGEGGVTLEWFETKDTELVNPVDAPGQPHVNATAVAPKYTLHMPPGRITLVAFGAGAHRFKGHALAISGHFLDIDAGSKLGPFMANTAGYKGSFPNESETLQLDTPKELIVEGEVSSSCLNDTFSLHSKVMREYIDKYGGKKLGDQEQLQLVQTLRESVHSLVASHS